jgi:Ca2+:H+ antiporter
MGLRNSAALLLLAFAPVSWAAVLLHWGDLAVCLTSALAILPLAIWLSTATEELATALGPTIGSLLTAVFGNASELILSLAALRAGLLDIVKASITGTLIANLLLALGLAFLVGGIGRSEQQFQPTVARVNGSLMTLAVLAILIPSLSQLGGPSLSSAASHGEEQFSQFVAWVLLIVYGLTLLFSLGTHRHLYDVAELDVAAQSEQQHRPAILPWLLVLLASTVALAVESELFVGVLEPVSEHLGLGGLCTGVVVLPLLGGIAEFITAMSMARRDKVDLAVSVALGSTLLVALLVVPLLVLLSPLLGHPLTLHFEIGELMAVITAVVVSNLVTLDGRSNWLEGVLLLATYIILAAGFVIQSSPLA